MTFLVAVRRRREMQAVGMSSIALVSLNVESLKKLPFLIHIQNS